MQINHRIIQFPRTSLIRIFTELTSTCNSCHFEKTIPSSGVLKWVVKYIERHNFALIIYLLNRKVMRLHAFAMLQLSFIAIQIKLIVFVVVLAKYLSTMLESAVAV